VLGVLAVLTMGLNRFAAGLTPGAMGFVVVHDGLAVHATEHRGCGAVALLVLIGQVAVTGGSWTPLILRGRLLLTPPHAGAGDPLPGRLRAGRCSMLLPWRRHERWHAR
jgi:hypothetical protein